MTFAQVKNKVMASNHQSTLEQYDPQCNSDSHVQKKHYTSSKGNDYELLRQNTLDIEKQHTNDMMQKGDNV